VPLSTVLRLVRHYCSPSCTFINHGSSYLCQASGNLHICSVHKCKHLQSDDETQWCDITANTFPLECVVPLQYDCITHTAPKPAPDVLRRPAKRARLHMDGMAEKHQTESLNTIRQVLGPLQDDEGVPLTESIDLMRIVCLAEDLWRKCIQTKEYSAQPFRYRHRYHVLVVLYASIKGLRMKAKATTLIPQNELVRRYMPPFKTLPKRITDLDISTFTKTNKIFLACMRELYEN
jgi:hypothetical protein